MKDHKGNEYWKKRKKHGKPKNIKSPSILWDLFCDYAARCDEHPLNITELKTTPKGKETKTTMKPIPYTWDGFEDYLFESGVINDLGDYEANTDNRYADYATIIKAIKRTIRKQKFEGAAAGIFNSNIIARDLGLSDKKEHSGNVKLAPITRVIVK
ncbi:DNA-packaging protein [Saprospiraceae bacterium]|nr:DNA-packaging protein [Saprospiraceae bacterium]